MRIPPRHKRKSYMQQCSVIIKWNWTSCLLTWPPLNPTIMESFRLSIELPQTRRRSIHGRKHCKGIQPTISSGMMYAICLDFEFQPADKFQGFDCRIFALHNRLSGASQPMIVPYKLSGNNVKYVSFYRREACYNRLRTAFHKLLG